MQARSIEVWITSISSLLSISHEKTDGRSEVITEDRLKHLTDLSSCTTRYFYFILQLFSSLNHSLKFATLYSRFVPYASVYRANKLIFGVTFSIVQVFLARAKMRSDINFFQLAYAAFNLMPLSPVSSTPNPSQTLQCNTEPTINCCLSHQ